MAVKHGKAGAARTGVMITRIFGLTRRIRTSFCWAAIRGRLSRLTTAKAGAHGITSRPRNFTMSARTTLFPIAYIVANKRAARSESRVAALMARSPFVIGTRRGRGIWLCRRRPARSRYYLRRQADPLRSTHRPGPGDSSSALAFSGFSNDPHPAGGLFSGRSALAFLFRQQPLADAGGWTELETDQPCSAAQDLRCAD